MIHQKFWVVWCPTHGTPMVKHYEKRSALREASRLAAANPGSEFVLLGSEQTVRKSDVVVEQHSENDYEIPF